MDEKFIKLGNVVLDKLSALGESMSAVKKMIVIRYWHISIPKLVLHGRPSLYRLLTSGCSHWFHVNPVWLAWPFSFIATNLTFLALESGYHVKYLSMCRSHSKKSWGSRRPSKVRTSNLMLFKYWSSGSHTLRPSYSINGPRSPSHSLRLMSRSSSRSFQLSKRVSNLLSLS